MRQARACEVNEALFPNPGQGSFLPDGDDLGLEDDDLELLNAGRAIGNGMTKYRLY